MSDIRYPHRNEEAISESERAIRESERMVSLPISVVITISDLLSELVLLREANALLLKTVEQDNARRLGLDRTWDVLAEPSDKN